MASPSCMARLVYVVPVHFESLFMTRCPSQHRMLYVFDPTALHSVIVKDQYIYEEAAFFIKYVAP